MTLHELPAQAADVLHAITSATTCNADTVESLRNLLNSRDVPLPKSQSALPIHQSKVPARNARGGRTIGKQSRKGRPVTVFEEPLNVQHGLSPREKNSCATQVINSTLQSLGAALKDSTISRSVKLEKFPARSKPEKTLHSVSARESNGPLEARCVNLVANLPGGKTSRRPVVLHSHNTMPGILAQAQCACIAFATLRRSQLEKNPKTDILLTELEDGASILIGKLVALGLHDLARQELVLLKKRLDDINPTSQDDCRQSAKASSEETLLDLLRCSEKAVTGPKLSITVALQFHVLRMIAARPSAILIEAALVAINPGPPWSLIGLIKRQLSADLVGVRDKAVHQLESLTHLLLSLSSQAIKDDGQLSKLVSTNKALAAFKLQALAFQARVTWWKIADHKGDVAKEVWQPFLNCLGFCRSRVPSTTDRYEACRSAFMTLLEQVQFYCSEPVTTFDLREKALVEVYESMAGLARESSVEADVKRWWKEAGTLSNKSKASEAQVFSIRCKSVAAQLSAPLDFRDDDLLQRELSIIQQKLNEGVVADTENFVDLLCSINNLRRSIILVMGQSNPTTKTQNSQTYELIDSRCESVLAGGVKFLDQCISILSARVGKTAWDERTAKLSQSVAKSWIEALVALAKYYSGGTERWRGLEASLQECLRVLMSLKRMLSSSDLSGTAYPPAASLQVSIANVYWSRSVYLRNNGAEPKAILEVLGISIDLLSDDYLEQETTGILVARLEQQGQLYIVDKDYEAAVESYARALRVVITTGSLSAMAEAAISQPPSKFFSDSSKWTSLRRLLKAYLKARSCIEGRSGIGAGNLFDIEPLPVRERGLLLEQQLGIIEDMPLGASISPVIRDAVRTVSSTLMSLYTVQQYPIRHLRVVNQLLLMFSKHPTILSSDFHRILCEPIGLTPDGVSLSLDSGLERYRVHLLVSHKVSIALCSEVLDPATINHSLAEWLSLLQTVSDYDSLCSCVDNIPNFLFQLECLNDCLEGHNLVLDQLFALRLLCQLHEVARPSQAANTVSRFTELGVLYTRLGNRTEAGLALHKAQRYLNTSGDDSSSTIRCRWYLAYAEYLLSLGSLENSEKHMMQAKDCLRQASSSKKSRCGWNKQWALLNGDAINLSSSLAVAQGQPLRALYLKRLTVKTMQAEWASIRLPTKKQTGASLSIPDAEEDDLIAPISSLSVSVQRPTWDIAKPYELCTRAKTWRVAPRLFDGLFELSTLYAHQGLFSEAYYYLKQAQRVGQYIPSASYEGRFHAQAGHHMFRCCHSDSAAAHFEKAQVIYKHHRLDYSYIALQLFLAEKHVLGKEFSSAESAFASANNALDHIKDEILTQSRLESSQASTLEDRMANMELTTVPIRHGKLSGGAPKGTDMANCSMRAPERGPATGSELLHDRRAYILRQQAFALMRTENLERANEVLIAAAGQVIEPHQRILQTLLEAQLSLHFGLESMASDLNFCVLPESTIACPSVEPLPLKQGQISEETLEKKHLMRRTKKATSKTTTKFTKVQSPSIEPEFHHHLQQTQENLTSICSLAFKAGSTANVHAIADVLSRTRIMLSSLGSRTSRSTGNPMSNIFITGTTSTSLLFSHYATNIARNKEIGKTLASVREGMALEVEKRMSPPLDPLDWIQSNDQAELQSFDGLDTSSDLLNFRTRYVDIIPDSWTVISFSLSESQNEVRVSRLRSDQSPFIISIPLNRHNSRDPDEETFSFDQGKAEMLDIINLANYSTLDMPDTSRKGAKTEWWEARAALDARLKDLLFNVESIWLGGFRGILSPDAQDNNLLLRFQQTLHGILDRHLPSRQKQPRSSNAGRVTLDIQVIELFVRLGDPNTVSLDEELTDLLYFVVDVLQFHGERNAYDEIDFDAITVEVLDALRQYRAAAEEFPDLSSHQHTILVLDKALHCFPWESLPCMRNRSVSRVPSLEFLRRRILQQLTQASFTSDSRFLVGSASGTYVLNPSGDLTATQSRFEEQLSALKDWTPIIQREPSETEFKAALQEKDLFLYFGHGSGGQYIRQRTIKKLDKCAVALLMGCSSGAMTEAGTFESYGTPLNYMHAGCPAVLATLWDVTDKDIDRFSQGVLEKWGLFEPQTPKPVAETVRRGSPVKRSRQKGKQKEVATKKNVRKTMGLDQAVAESRDSCIMKYLNGAAPVIYGIPVFLS